VAHNRTQSAERASSLTYYQRNPIDPTLQDVTVLHYRINLSKLVESEEAKKNLARAQCLAMCPAEEIH